MISTRVAKGHVEVVCIHIIFRRKKKHGFLSFLSIAHIIIVSEEYLNIICFNNNSLRDFCS